MSVLTTDEVRMPDEATIDLRDTSKWYCETHGTWVKTGKDCLFCLHEQFGDAIFT